MLALISFFASVPVSVPDSGMTALLVGSGVLSLGVFARMVKNRKK